MSTKKILTLLMLLFLAGKSFAQSPPSLDSIYGYIFRDVDGDCIKDPFETGLENWDVTVILVDTLFF